MTKQKRILVAGVSALAVAFVVIAGIFLLPKDAAESISDAPPDKQEASGSVSIEEPATETVDKSEMSTTTVVDSTPFDPEGRSVLQADKAKTDTPPKSETGQKAGKAAEKVTESTPEEKGGIRIGESEQEEPYSCGTENHKCNSPENHAYVLNLELAGCPYCGSHSCPSFYGTDQWGNAGLFPKLCPEYDIKKDPAEYCQTCGKPCKDGQNGTCVVFNEDVTCPHCGKTVKAWECHSCD